MKNAITLVLLTASMAVAAQSGITWTTATNIAANSFGNNHPRITLDRNGNPLVIWGRPNDQSVFFSRWDGSAFSTPVKLNGSLTVATADWMGPDIASHGDTVYVVMKETPESSTDSHIYLASSFNGGVDFGLPVRVDFIADSVSRFPTVSCDASGNPIVAFMKFNSSFLDSRWVITQSFDYGNTFSTDVKASGWGGSGAVCDCCPGAVLSHGDYRAMLYRDNNSNIRDTWMGLSSDGGNSFGNGCNVDNNNWLLPGCPSTGPDGIVIGDTLYAVFCNGASGKYLGYISQTSLSTVACEDTRLLTANTSGISQQNYPRIAAFGMALGVVWQQTENGAAKLPLLFTNDIAQGLPANYETVDSDHITNTDIAIGKGTISICWQDNNSGTVKIRTGVYTPAATGVSGTAIQSAFGVFPNPAAEELHIIPHSPESFSAILLNTLGEQVYSTPAGTGPTRIDLQPLPNGTYTVLIQTESGSVVRKVVVQR